MMRRDYISIILFLVFFVATLADEMLEVPVAFDLAMASLVGFIAIEISHVARLHLIAAALLTGTGVLTGYVAGDVFATLLKGIERTAPFLLLFGGVLCLRIPANHSPILLSLRDTVVIQPPGRRYFMTGVVAHFMTIVFNLAGITLLSSLIRPGTEGRLQRRLGRAMSQGLASATCWAPFFVAAVVIYSVLPTVRWSSIAPVGVVLSIILLGWGWLTDRLFVRPDTASNLAGVTPPEYTQPLSGRAWFNLAGLLALLLSGFVIAISGAGLTVPVAMALIAPPFAYLWLQLIRRKPRVDAPDTPDLSGILTEIPGLRNEATLFCAANILAVGIGAAVTQESAAATALDWVGSPFLLLSALVVVHGVVNALGVHPVVPAILIPTLLPPEAIGISPELMALSLLAMWGQGAAVSPFSATAFVLARLSGCSNWMTSWGWNGWYVASSTLIILAFLYVLNVMKIFN